MNWRTNSFMIIAVFMLICSSSISVCAKVTYKDIAPQKYGSSLIESTSKEVLQAYSLLDELKQKTDEFNKTHEAAENIRKIGPNIDSIRQRLLEKKLIAVLSATRFTNSTKHLQDCNAAREALKEYVGHLEKLLNKKKNHSSDEVITPRDSISPAEPKNKKPDVIIHDSADIEEHLIHDTEETSSDFDLDTAIDDLTSDDETSNDNSPKETPSDDSETETPAEDSIEEHKPESDDVIVEDMPAPEKRRSPIIATKTSSEKSATKAMPGTQRPAVNPKPIAEKKVIPTPSVPKTAPAPITPKPVVAPTTPKAISTPKISIPSKALTPPQPITPKIPKLESAAPLKVPAMPQAAALSKEKVASTSATAKSNTTTQQKPASTSNGTITIPKPTLATSDAKTLPPSTKNQAESKEKVAAQPSVTLDKPLPLSTPEVAPLTETKKAS